MPLTPGPQNSTEAPSAGRRRLLLPALLLLAALPAWPLASRGIAMALASRDPSTALRWDPANAEALVLRNESERTPAAKRGRARAVLAQRPRDGRAYRQLAEVAQADGDLSSARDLYRLAAKYSPRDRWTQAWLADDALRMRWPMVALSHIDQLLSIDALLPRHMFAVIIGLAQQDPVFSAALVRTLRMASWRDDFLGRWLAGAAPSAPTLASLRDAGVPISGRTRTMLVMRALREDRATEAWLTWADGLAPARASRLGLVVNGDFEHPPSGAFDWQLGTDSAADVQRALRPDRGELALRIEFDGERTQFRDVAQQLLLMPGAYRFSVWVRPEELRSGPGLMWTMRCGSEAGRLIGRGDVLEGTTPWRRHGFDFVVPDRCALQWLSLELPELHTGESVIGGTLWIDEVAIRPAAGPGAFAGSGPESAADTGAVPPQARPMAMLSTLGGPATLIRGNLRMQVGPHALVRLHDRVIPAPGTHLRLRWPQGCDTLVDAPLRIEAPSCDTAMTAPVMPARAQVPVPDPIQAALRASWASEPSRDDPVGP